MALGRLQLRFWERPWFWRALARGYGLRGEDAELLVTTGLGIRRSTAQAILEEVGRGMPPAVLEGVGARTLAVAGERDRGAVASLAAFENATTAVARSVGHQWNLESPPLFNAVVRLWLERGAVDERLKLVTPRG